MPKFYLINDRVRQNAIEAIRNAEPMSVVNVSEPKRSIDQNALMWSMLTDIAKAKPEGRNWTVETWKAAFLHSLGHQVMFAEGLDGSGPFPVGFRSSNLKVKQMTDLIDCISEYGARHGVQFKEAKKQGWMT
jgi:hypothetical protein